jgi:hypothetical protein
MTGRVSGVVLDKLGRGAVGFPIAALGLSVAGSASATSSGGGSYAMTLPVGDWFVFTTWAAFAPTMPDPFPPTGCPAAPPLSVAEEAQLRSYENGLNLGCAIGVSAGRPQTVNFQERSLVGPTTTLANQHGASDTVSRLAVALVPCTTTSTMSTTVTSSGDSPVAVSSAQRHRRRTRRVVVVGKKTTTIQPGRTATVTVNLNLTGRRLLRRFGKLPTTLTITLSVNGKPATLTEKRLTLKSKHTRPGKH